MEGTMRRLVKLLGICGLAAGMIGCASTVWNGYQGGTVKYSEVSYNYTAQPVLKDPAGKTYQLQTDAALGAIRSVAVLEKQGVRRVESGADVVISVTSGPITHEPGGAGFKKFTPATISTMPIKIEVKDKSGQLIIERELKHQEMLTLQGAKQYDTREEATAAMAVITEFAKSSADSKVRQGAPGTVNKNLALIAKDLFEPRKVSVALPAVRSAGNVDMDSAYKLLAKAKSDEQVKAALAVYAALGVENKKADGTDDVVGNYGVLCGLASARILSGDLAGAWQDAKKACQVFPEGKERMLIVEVLRKQQQQAGVEIIPQAEYDEMVKQENNADMDQLKDGLKSLKGLFGGGK
jgi:hypothetical protein